MADKNRNEYFMKMALLASERSTCKTKVGAVAIKENRVIATAYNGAPSEMAECEDVGCKIVNGHCQRAIHAEQNIINLAARFGFSLKESIIYCTHEPCANCLRNLISAGITKLYFLTEKFDKRSLPEYYERVKTYKLMGDKYLRFRRLK